MSKQPLVVAVGLLGLACYMLADVLFRGGAYYERDLLIYMQMADALVRAVAEGAWPLRDPTMGFGQPIMGTPDAAVLYPPTWLNFVFLPERAYGFFVLLHYFLGATGAAALGFRFSRSKSSAFFSGAFWLVGGPFQSFLTLWHHLAGASWMPWVLFVFDHAVERPTLRNSLLLGAVFGLQILAGSADMCAMTMALALLLLLCRARESPAGSTLKTLKVAAGAIAIAACLSAATWLTVAEVTQTSTRASLPRETRTYWSVHPALMAEMALPLNLGSMGLNSQTRTALFEGREPFVKSLFLGSLVLPLFVGALFSREINFSRRLFAVTGLLGSLFLAFGSFTPVYDAAVTLFPFLKIFRFPSKVMIPFSLIASVVAGAGVNALAENRSRFAARLTASFLVALHLALVLRGADLLPLILSDTEPAAVAQQASTLTLGLSMSALSLLLLVLALVVDRPRLVILAVATSIVFTAMLNSGINPAVVRSVFRYRPPHVSLLATSGPSRVYVEDYVHSLPRSRQFLGKDSPLMAMHAPGVPANVARIVGIRSMLISPVGGQWGIEYAWDEDLRGLFHTALRETTEHIRDIEGSFAFLRLLQVANVSHVVSMHTSTLGQLQLEQSVSVPSLQDPIYIFRVPEPLPHAYAVDGVAVFEAENAVKALVAPEFNPRTHVVLDAGVSAPSSATFKSTVTIENRRSDRIALDASLSEPGHVILSEGFLPGWQATIDGTPTHVQRANAFFISVASPAGNHKVVFTYRPWTAVAGTVITLGTAILLVFAIHAALRRSSE